MQDVDHQPYLRGFLDGAKVAEVPARTANLPLEQKAVVRVVIFSFSGGVGVPVTYVFLT